jgi:hypothetical protein
MPALLGRQRMMKARAKAVQLMWILNEIIVQLAKTRPLWPKAPHKTGDHVAL